jgi:long-chain acyl-CoA synthetase
MNQLPYLGAVLCEQLATRPDDIALIFEGESFSYQSIEDQSDLLAANLQQHVKPGSRVAWHLPNNMPLVWGYLACFKMGAIATPLNYRFKGLELAYTLKQSGSSILVIESEKWGDLDLDALADVKTIFVVGALPSNAKACPVPVFSFDTLLSPEYSLKPVSLNHDSPAAILYTSGSTGFPKGALHTHGSMIAGLIAVSTTLGSNPDDTILIPSSICHAAGLNNRLMSGFYCGATLVMAKAFDLETLMTLVKRYPISLLFLFSATLNQLLQHPEINTVNFSAMRHCGAGGDKVPAQLKALTQKILGVPLTDTMGMTECPWMFANNSSAPDKTGSLGVPHYTLKTRLVDDAGENVARSDIGELWIQSSVLFKQYWNKPDETQKAFCHGWFKTGDMMREDEGGYFWFVSRKKLLIIRGGSNMAPQEIESVLLEHDAVAAAVAVGKADKKDGAVPVAFVSLKEGASRVSPESFIAFMQNKIAPYKIPVAIVVLETMPLNATGKLDRNGLVNQAKTLS